MTDTNCEACATQGPLIEALTKDNARLRRELQEEKDARLIDGVDKARAERAEARVVELEGRIGEIAVNCPSCGRHDFGLMGPQIAENLALTKRVAVLEAALRTAADVFRGYAEHHGRKARVALDGPLVDASDEYRAAMAKAKANDEHVERIEKVLRGREP